MSQKYTRKQWRRLRPQFVKRHYESTLLSRFGLIYADVRGEIATQMQDRTNLLGKQSNTRLVYKLNLRGKVVYMVWDRKHKNPRTFLTQEMIDKRHPLEDYE